jgi:hypothetical protein
MQAARLGIVRGPILLESSPNFAIPDGIVYISLKKQKLREISPNYWGKSWEERLLTGISSREYIAFRKSAYVR